MERDLSTFPISSKLQGKLANEGFVTSADLDGVEPADLSKDLEITQDEASSILQTLTQQTPGTTDDLQGKSVLDLMKEEGQPIVTFSLALDDMLGGGIPIGKITEVCGAPGVGKSQLGMQASVSCRVPDVFGGLGGEAVYIDTEGSFIAERMGDIAMGAVSHCEAVVKVTGEKDQVDALREFTIEGILRGVHYFRCRDVVELAALSNLLPQFVRDHSKVRLVVVDSIAFPFRVGFKDFSQRSQILSSLAQSFIHLATGSRLAVLLINQMTTRMPFASKTLGAQSRNGCEGEGRGRGGNGGDPVTLIPALGESWSHTPTLRLLLGWHGDQRVARLLKAPGRRDVAAPYEITAAGIRDSSGGDTTTTSEKRKNEADHYSIGEVRAKLD